MALITRHITRLAVHMAVEMIMMAAVPVSYTGLFMQK